MATNTELVQQMYVAYFNRPAEPGGLTYWVGALDAGGTVAQMNLAFSTENEYKAAYANMTNDQIVNTVYMNLFGRGAETLGLDYWSNLLTQKKITVANIVADVAAGAQGTDATAFANKTAAAVAFTSSLTAEERVAYTGPAALTIAKNFIAGVTTQETLESSLANLAETTASLVTAATPAGTLTNGTDNLTAVVFNAGLVYTPSGDDRINSLQSEDVLTGASKTVDNTLNATLGIANDNGAASITPTLKNIQKVNLEITGNTNTLDVRFADSLESLAINKLTAEASNTVNINNIGQVAADLTVRNSAAVDNTVNFNYISGVLAAKNAAGTAAGGNTGNVAVENVALAVLKIGNNLNTEGFETINLNSKGDNTVKNLLAVDAETVTITGAGSLNMINNVAGSEFVTVNAGGITIGDGIGIRSINAAAFEGNMNLNITAAVGGHNDPGNSGKVFHTNVAMGTGNDTLWTTASVTSTTVAGVVLADTIDGGTGTDTLRTYSAGVTKNAKITNVEALELRGAGSVAYVSAFDANLTSALVRNEVGAASQTFSLANTSKALAENGQIVLRHGVTGGVATVDQLNVNLATATGSSDTVVVTVQNDLNTGTLFNYNINAQSQFRVDTPGATAAENKANRVENVTINDDDTETNIVALTQAADHVGTVTLTHGTADLDYTVTSTLVAATVDASTQASNLRLNVGTANQTIKLGSGSDILTFTGLNTFNGSDKITDAGGTDTVRAAFSADVTGTPDLTGIEKLHIVATANVSIDMAKAATVSELAILSNTATDGSGDLSPLTAEPFTLTGVDKTDTITLKNTALAELNYFADNDTNDVATNSESPNHVFNAVTLENNSVADVTVKINSSLDVAVGADTYTLGKITAHGVATLDIEVGDEADDAITSIENIYGKNLETVTVSTAGNANLGLVSGNATNNNLTVLNASAVELDFAVQVNSLGNGAVVTAGGGDSWIDARNSAGNSAKFSATNGSNTIYGAAGADDVTTGAGIDVISVDRGQNIVRSGGGNDFVVGSNQDNTVDVGTGYNLVNFNRVFDAAGTTLGGSGLVATAATNTVSVAGGVASAFVYLANGIAVDREINLATASTADSVTVSYLGNALQSATRNGTNAVTLPAFVGTAADDFFVDSTDAGATESGSDGNDMLVGGSGADTLGGDAGNDILSGNAGDDSLNGGAGDDILLGGSGDDTLVGADGVDTIYAGDGVDAITAGTGADLINLASNSDATQWTPGTATGDAGTVDAPSFAFAVDMMIDTLTVAAGDSTAAAWDKVTAFDTVVTNDVLNLDSVTIGVTGDLNNGAITGTNGANTSLNTTAAAGIVTFGIADVTATLGVETTARVSAGADLAAGDTVGVISLAAALAFLATELNGTLATVAFAYDSNGDGVLDARDSTIVFQDGVADTVIELVGVFGVTAVAAAAAANTIVIG